MSDQDFPKEYWEKQDRMFREALEKCAEEIVDLFAFLIDKTTFALVSEEMKLRVREVLNKHFFTTYDT